MADATTLRIGGDASGLVGAVQQARSSLGSLPGAVASSAQAIGRELAATEQQASHTGGVLGNLKTLAGGVFAGFSAMAVVQGLKTLAVDAVNVAGTMTDLGHQSGVLASKFMQMANAAELSGVDVNSLSTLLTKMTDTIAGGDTAAAAAVETLGLNLGALQRLSPDEMFLTLVASLSKVSDANLQTKLTFDIFGRGAKDALKLVRDEFAETTAASSTWSEEQIATLDRVGDAWTVFKQQSTTAMGAFISGIDGMWAAQGRAGGNLNLLLNPFALRALDRSGFTSPTAPTRGPVSGAPSLALGLPDEAELSAITKRLTDLAAAQKTATQAAEAHAKALAGVTGLDKVQVARALVKLIEELGGTGKIAASQFEAVNKTLTAGIVIGTELRLTLPSAMVQFARETQTANNNLVDMATYLKSLPALVQHIPPPMPAGVPQGVGTGVPDYLTGYPHVVVGGAFVPNPQQAFLDRASAQWRTFTEGVSGVLGDMVVGLRTWKDGLLDIWHGVLSQISRLIGGVFDGVLRRLGAQAGARLGVSVVGSAASAGTAGAAGAAGAAGSGAAAGGMSAATAGTLAGGIGVALGAYLVGSKYGRAAGIGTGAAAGAAYGSMFGPVGAGIGAVAGGTIGWIGGEITAGRRRRENREATSAIASTQGDLIGQYGSVAAIGALNPAGQALAAAWGSQGVAGAQQFATLLGEFNTMTAEQNRLLGEQKTIQDDLTEQETERARLAESLIVPYSRVEEIASRYKLDLEGLGKGISQVGTTTNFTTILNDLDALKRAAEQAGTELDWGGALKGMREEISALVTASMRMGTAIPENMRPFVEELSRSGQLLDDTGKAIADLSGLKWGPAVATQAEIVKAQMDVVGASIDRLTTALDAVVLALSTLLPKAAADGSADLQRSIITAGRTVRVVTGGLVDDFGEVEEAAARAAHGSSPTGIKEITVVAKQAGEQVKTLGKISYQTFSTIEESAAYWAHTTAASFDTLGEALTAMSRTREDLMATPAQRQALALDREEADQRAKLAAFKDDPRYTQAMALLAQTTALKGQQLTAETARTTGSTLAERIARTREAAAAAMDLNRQLAYTRGQQRIGEAAMGATLGVIASAKAATARAPVYPSPTFAPDATSLDGAPVYPSPTFVFNISAVSADGFERIVERDIMPALTTAWRRNSLGARTTARVALGVA